MDILQTILSILQMVLALIIIFLVLLQSDNESGSIVTGAEGNSNMGMSRDKKLSRLTVWFGTAFVILTIASASIMLFNIN